MSRRFPVHAITHIHTRASNGPASDMDGMIGGAIRHILGQDTPASWSECFTTVDRLRDLLARKRPRPVGIIAVTDHMNSRSCRLPDNLLRAAASEPRLAACGELRTVDRDMDGEFRKAPEVLVYGSPRPVDGPYGPHFGLSQELIEDLYATCRAPGSSELQTTRVFSYCARNSLACALAHPFDGHGLSLEATFDLISRARFVETINGGFPAVSTRILEDLLAFQNRVVSGFRLPPGLALRFPVARRLAELIAGQRRSMLHPWGGSDAHSHAFSRVTVRFLAHRPNPTAGDMFAAMLSRPVEDLLVDGTFSVHGRPGSAFSVLDDIVRIVIRNFWHIRPHIWNKPFHMLRMAATTPRVVSGELGRRASRQAELVRCAEHEFDSNRILKGMLPPRRVTVREHHGLPVGLGVGA